MRSSVSLYFLNMLLFIFYCNEYFLLRRASEVYLSHDRLAPFYFFEKRAASCFTLMCLSINNVILAFILPLYKNVLFFSGGKWLQKLYSLNVIRIWGLQKKRPILFLKLSFCGLFHKWCQYWCPVQDRGFEISCTVCLCFHCFFTVTNGKNVTSFYILSKL